jgi:hypothetical protein
MVAALENADFDIDRPDKNGVELVAKKDVAGLAKHSSIAAAESSSLLQNMLMSLAAVYQRRGLPSTYFDHLMYSPVASPSIEGRRIVRCSFFSIAATRAEFERGFCWLIQKAACCCKTQGLDFFFFSLLLHPVSVL